VCTPVRGFSCDLVRLSRKACHLLLHAAIPLYVVLTVSGCTKGSEAGEVLTFSERELRSYAIAKPLPVYPIDSRACGVVVGEITIKGNGDVSRRKVLQAPNKATELAMISALDNWRFHAIEKERGKRVEYIGKLTFYFVPGETAGRDSRVFDAEDAPNIASCVDHDLDTHIPQS
jgi:hypothetical protein